MRSQWDSSDRTLHQWSLLERCAHPLNPSYAARGFVDGLRGQLDRIWNDQYADRWEQYVYETIGTDQRTVSGRRRIKMALARAPEPIAKADVSLLTSALAGIFATKTGNTGKTLTCDLNDLVVRGLLVRQPDGYVANVAVLRGSAASPHRRRARPDVAARCRDGPYLCPASPCRVARAAV